MKKYILSALVALISTTLLAVPAYRGWQTKTQPDGTTITVRQGGDEYFHYWENEAGQQVKQDSLGYWQVVGNAPTPTEVAKRRTIRKSTMRKAIGVKNLAPRGLVILVNYSDQSFATENTQSAMNEMMNGEHYTYNGAVGSARQYFIDQSDGAYTPTFDVVGPVTLNYPSSHYGSNDPSTTLDVLAGDLIIEACKLADTQCGVDFTQYDNDNDGKVDFVYVIYAGKGEADGGGANTVWPHNWEISATIRYGYCSYKTADCYVDGKMIETYACSGEINGTTNRRAGIGTLCHEFSHVLGLPDFYDTTEEAINKKNGLTPGRWDIMDSGNYNQYGNCPPNYSAWEKYFFGWTTPQILNTPSNITLTTAYGDCYQINESGTQAAWNNTATQYYIENRQQTGWDSGLPGHGMLVWKVQFNAKDWANNEPNNTVNQPRYTLVSAAGTTKIEANSKVPFPGSTGKDYCTPLSQYPLTDIQETSGTVSFHFMGGEKKEGYVYLSVDLEGVVPGSILKDEISSSQDWQCRFTADECYYDLGKEEYLIELLINDEDKTELYVTQDENTVNIHIPASALTGNVELAFYNEQKLDIVKDAEHATISGEDCVEGGTDYTCTITANKGYKLDISMIEILMGEDFLEPGTDFTYVGTTLTIPNVTGEVYILASAKEDQETGVRNTREEALTTKKIVNGQLLIEREGYTYDILGTRYVREQ